MADSAVGAVGAVGAGPGSAVRPLCRLFDEYFSFAVTFTAKFEA